MSKIYTVKCIKFYINIHTNIYVLTSLLFIRLYNSIAILDKGTQQSKSYRIFGKFFIHVIGFRFNLDKKLYYYNESHYYYYLLHVRHA